MELGERIKKRRKELGISVDFVAKELGVSVSTVYRYEDSSIEKIPVHVFDSLCRILQTTPTRLMGNEVDEDTILPENFGSPQEAMEFILKLPSQPMEAMIWISWMIGKSWNLPMKFCSS